MAAKLTDEQRAQLAKDNERVRQRNRAQRRGNGAAFDAMEESQAKFIKGFREGLTGRKEDEGKKLKLRNK